MKAFLIWVGVSIGSLFGMHSQPVTPPASAPVQVVQTQTRQSVDSSSVPTDVTPVPSVKAGSVVDGSQSPAIAPKDIICPGGIPCPNQGAIKVSLSSNVWKVGNTYRVTWTNSLPKSTYDFYYVEIGVGTTSPRFPNGGDPGFYKVDGSKNYLDINFDSHTAEMRVLNSESRNYDTVKNVFFAEVMAMNANDTPMWQDDKTVAVGDSPLFSVQGYSGYSYPVSPTAMPSAQSATTLAQAQAIGRHARIQADVVQLRVMAELAYETSHTFATFCQNGLVNTSAYKDLPALVQDIVSTQGAADQAHAGLTCVSSPSKYAFGITFTSQTAKPGVTSFCMDSSGNGGDSDRYVLNQSAISCQSQ